ncbi:hypothetical protein HC251_22480 [Iamia sp. SCSIO 61187]|uniref:hypothetical protein n=1 Tax=Iamia sp. SCSIO 61187 TaxID=2722752 RepID=UPI001C624D8E|nr:hypothetical protein [Iamia sp. SCSIO 61187]QYG94923.1 hypothetical protein HC251_22480 [Iamia sp. SCSIO 61187]
MDEGQQMTGRARLVTVESRYAGPPQMGHGGYVAGLLTGRWPGAVEVTLRRATPLDTPLRLDEQDPSRSSLWHGDDLVAEAVPTDLVLDVPRPPTRDEAAAAEAGSPARQGPGVHPTCFGCGLARTDGHGLRIAAGPVPGSDGDQVAAVWRPDPGAAGPDGWVDGRIVVAALDCPGAFAFIAAGEPAGLLGRITVRRDAPVPADQDLIVTGWRIGSDGRKLLAGTALFSTSGELLAAAKAVWFPFPSG